MGIFTSISELLTIAGRRVRAWSWPTRLSFVVAGWVGLFLSSGLFFAALIAAATWYGLLYWGDAIEQRRKNAAQR